MVGWPADNPCHNPSSLISTFVMWRGCSVEVGSGRLTPAGAWGRSAVHDWGRRPLRSAPASTPRFGALSLCGEQLSGQFADGDKPLGDLATLGTCLACPPHRGPWTASAFLLHHCRTSHSYTPLVQRWSTAHGSCGADRNGKGDAATALCYEG